MPVESHFHPPVVVEAFDFWRSNAGADLPDGVNDTTESITRSGLVGLGVVPGLSPIAWFDLATGARTGVDGRVPDMPFYITANYPIIETDGSLPLITPIGGAEFIHSQQDMGIGIAANGLYAGGSDPSSFAFMQRGNMPYNFMYQSRISDSVISFDVGSAPTIDTEYLMQWRQLGLPIANMHVYSETDTPHSTRFQFDILGSLGGLSTALRIRRLHDGINDTDNTELYVGENQRHSRKIVLNSGFDNLHQFIGIGSRSSVMEFHISAQLGSHSFFAGIDSLTSLELLRITGTGGITIDPNSLADAGYAPPNIQFGGPASTESIKSQRVGVGNLFGLQFYTQGLLRFEILQAGTLAAYNVPLADDTDFMLTIDAIGNIRKTDTTVGNLFIKVSAPVNLLSNQNNYAPTTEQLETRFFNFVPDGAYEITGVQPPVISAGFAPKITIYNEGPFTITIRDNDVSSLVGNRFKIGTDVVMLENQCFSFLYINNFWCLAD